ncbi:ABC-three component system middle component 2 [Paenibacillus sp. TH7-28]
MMTTKIKIFNSPEEVGVRVLFILSLCEKRMSSQRIMYYDYFILHLNDIDDMHSSLHPDNPNHSSEIAVKRNIVNKGLSLIISKGLIDVKYMKTGVYYQKNSLTDPFISLFSNGYVERLKKNIIVVNEKFSKFSDTQIYKYINKNIGSWTGEFEKEYNSVGELFE